MMNETNRLRRREFICDITRLLFDPGCHSRSKMWIWENFIRPALGIGYQTYLRESKMEVSFDTDRIVRLVAKLDILAERGRLMLERHNCLQKLPETSQIDETLRRLTEETGA